ncbi:MAG: hypothetical protein NXI04_16225 [Planctomycetaceae bacterium]|nr:hypothetical protein [Planctomycetaceae bacterium]
MVPPHPHWDIRFPPAPGQEPVFEDQLYIHVLDRFQRFSGGQECGKWNQTLLADFTDDDQFWRDAREMIERCVTRAVSIDGPVADGLDLHSVLFEAGVSICIRFHHHFLDPVGVCPLGYTLSAVGNRLHRVEFACGHPNELGGLRCSYPDRYRGRYESFPDAPHQWAVFRTWDVAVSDAAPEMGLSRAKMPSGSLMKRRQCHAQGDGKR